LIYVNAAAGTGGKQPVSGMTSSFLRTPMRPRETDPTNADWTVLSRQFESLIGQLAALCNELEFVADSLPRDIDSHACLSVAQRMMPLIKHAHSFEEEVLYPLLVAGAHQDQLDSVIERLKYEHWGDEDFAEQLYHLIRSFVAEQTPERAESLSWMLRGFFEGMRRHLAFEKDHLLPLMTRPG
jgi:iron-sulfur cluster repair protein YtfE (RIC family)